MSEAAGKLDTQADEDRLRHQDEAARRIYALPLPWPVKVEIWKEEMCQFESTFWRVLQRCNLQPLADELQDPNE